MVLKQVLKLLSPILVLGIIVVIVSYFFIYINSQIAIQCQQMIQSKSYLHNFSISKYQSVLIDSYNFSDYKIGNITIIADCIFTNKTTGEGYAFG